MVSAIEPQIRRQAPQLGARIEVPSRDDVAEPYATVVDDLPARDGSRHARTLALGFRSAYLIEELLRPGRGGTRERTLVELRPFARTATLLRDGIDRAAQNALGLDQRRLDALDRFDVVRTLVEGGDLTAARRLGGRSLVELQRAFGTSRGAGDAELRRPIVRDTSTAARLAERALAAFVRDPREALGRVRQVLCTIADLAGGERAAWEQRDDRGRQAPFFTAVGPAATVTNGLRVLALPCALVHPGRSQIRAVPLLPPDETARMYLPATSPYGGEVELDDPVTARYDALRRHAGRWLQLAATEQGRDLRDGAAADMQHALDELVASVRAPVDPAALDGWGAPAPPDRAHGPPRPGRRRGDPAGTASAVWLDRDTVVVERDGIASVISLSARAVLRRIALGGARLQACDDSGRFVLVGDTPERFGCVEAATGTWLELLPSSIPPAGVIRGFGGDRFVELRRGAAIALAAGRRPLAIAFARGNRAVLACGDRADAPGDGIRSTVSGLEEVAANVLARRRAETGVPMLLANGDVIEAPTADDERRLRDELDARWVGRPQALRPAAIAFRHGRWRFLLPDLRVSDVQRCALQLGFPIDAASFSPDGGRLLVVGAQLLAIDLATRAIVHRAPMDAFI